MTEGVNDLGQNSGQVYTLGKQANEETGAETG